MNVQFTSGFSILWHIVLNIISDHFFVNIFFRSVYIFVNFSVGRLYIYYYFCCCCCIILLLFYYFHIIFSVIVNIPLLIIKCTVYGVYSDHCVCICIK